MSAVRVLTFFVAALVSAGAVGTFFTTPTPPDTASAATTSAPISWDLLDCTFVIASATAPGDLIQPYLPSGFRPIGARGLINTPVESRTVSNIGFEVNICESGAGLDGEQVPDMTYASFWVGVRPPIAKRLADVQDYFVNWNVLIPDAPRREALVAAGLPAHDGAIRIDGPTPGEEGVLTVEYTLDGLGTFRYGGPVAPDTAAAGLGTFAQWTQAADGQLAFWRVDWTTTANSKGAGTLELDPDSWLTELFGGATTVPVQLWLGKWSYTNGEIRLPG